MITPMNVYPTNSYYKEMITKSFEEQRKERLQESIDEYLNEGDVDVDLFYKDLRDCITDVLNFHKIRAEKAQQAMDAVLGHRPIDELVEIGDLLEEDRL